MNKMILVVDPQVDFISGSLPVPGAQEAMDSLAKYLLTHGSEYCLCVITADWHPARHMSFFGMGGQWPEHCVAFSVGAAIYPPVYEAALRSCGTTRVLTKGTDADTEEYSVFSNEESSKVLEDLIDSYEIERIDICGLAGDVCVCRTLKDGIGIYGWSIFNVLKKFSPSIDGGIQLDEIINKFDMKCNQ